MNEMPTMQPQAAPSRTVRREPFSFTGTAREYFGIWIVNVLLTIQMPKYSDALPVNVMR